MAAIQPLTEHLPELVHEMLHGRADGRLAMVAHGEAEDDRGEHAGEAEDRGFSLPWHRSGKVDHRGENMSMLSNPTTDILW